MKTIALVLSIICLSVAAHADDSEHVRKAFGAIYSALKEGARSDIKVTSAEQPAKADTATESGLPDFDETAAADRERDISDKLCAKKESCDEYGNPHIVKAIQNYYKQRETAQTGVVAE